MAEAAAARVIDLSFVVPAPVTIKLGPDDERILPGKALTAEAVLGIQECVYQLGKLSEEHSAGRLEGTNLEIVEPILVLRDILEDLLGQTSPPMTLGEIPANGVVQLALALMAAANVDEEVPAVPPPPARPRSRARKTTATSTTKNAPTG
jgi:hypothetical protein